MTIKYSVKTFRDAGLEAKWTHNRSGAPIISVRDPQAKSPHQRDAWWCINRNTWEDMVKQPKRLREIFGNATLLGDIFSIPA